MSGDPPIYYTTTTTDRVIAAVLILAGLWTWAYACRAIARRLLWVSWLWTVAVAWRLAALHRRRREVVRRSTVRPYYRVDQQPDGRAVRWM